MRFEFGKPLEEAIRDDQQKQVETVIGNIIREHERGTDAVTAYLETFCKIDPKSKGKGKEAKIAAVDGVIKQIVEDLDRCKAQSITRCAQMSIAARDPKPGTKKVEYNFKPPLSSHRVSKDRYQAVLNFVPAVQNFNYLPVRTDEGNFLLANESKVRKLFSSAVALPSSGFMHEDKRFVHNLWYSNRGGFQLYSFDIAFRGNQGGGCHPAYLKYGCCCVRLPFSSCLFCCCCRAKRVVKGVRSSSRRLPDRDSDSA